VGILQIARPAVVINAMNDFTFYLDKTGEIGHVEKNLKTLVYLKGLPEIKPNEVVFFENGYLGVVLGFDEDLVEVLVLGNVDVGIGTKAARTDQEISTRVGEDLLGKMINPLGFSYGTEIKEVPIDGRDGNVRVLEEKPVGIDKRKIIQQPFVTGVSVVDLLVSLGKGQRELVIGDRKTGKTDFLHQVTYAQATQGVICIYCSIAKSRFDIDKSYEYFREKGVSENVILVSTSASDPAGLIYLAPYAAMSVAEYFRDQGKDVLLVLDDMTAHAKYYREISLLAGRFPGRSSYPGDIFYIHSRLLERAGNFNIIKKKENGKVEQKEVSITCLPVAEMVMGDFSGYIQTNLMSMTDGNIFFDIDLFNKGFRPPVNTYLSVTRVGRQAQTPLLRSLSSVLTSFLVKNRELKEFMQFGAELTEETKRTLNMGEKIEGFLNQGTETLIPLNVNILIVGLFWAKYFKSMGVDEVKQVTNRLINFYSQNENVRKQVDEIVDSCGEFQQFVNKLMEQQSWVNSVLK
jgi:F-type H+-transporting ATPase subunit alpha